MLTHVMFVRHNNSDSTSDCSVSVVFTPLRDQYYQCIRHLDIVFEHVHHIPINTTSVISTSSSSTSIIFRSKLCPSSSHRLRVLPINIFHHLRDQHYIHLLTTPTTVSNPEPMTTSRRRETTIQLCRQPSRQEKYRFQSWQLKVSVQILSYKAWSVIRLP